MGRIIIGFLGLGVGFVLIWQANWLTTNLGRIPWAEKYLGVDGGTRLFYKLLGFLVIIFAFLYMFGFMEGIITGIFSPLMPKNNL